MPFLLIDTSTHESTAHHEQRYLVRAHIRIDITEPQGIN